MKTVIITGAGRGIGRATALLLAQRGYQVVVNYHQRQQTAQDVVDEIQRAGGRAIAIQADLADEAQIVSLFQRVDAEFGAPDALVNNAGILFSQTRVEELSASRINKVFATNVTGTFICCREAVKRMALQHGGKGGAIVNISSVAARVGSPGEYVDYAASKGAVDTLTRGLALEVATQGIRVNGVRPGVIYTEMHADGGEPGRVDRVAPAVPMQRGGQPAEIAEAVAWLLSEAASYVTGSFIDVSGGR
ncbi:SDR family oxidoreductase [Paramixta manurensis]|uniref:SDR family oxidoreductase n=1 Tax=Paramixta manurensis TaxID=2740817 RepID=A0A6M8UCI0_9GAMM|nr:SDR family oxidoreductase [Erwiniaceae bacterium PD-1]